MHSSIGNKQMTPPDNTYFVVRDLQRRLQKLESEEKKSFLKTITTSASTTALLLGLIITASQLWDVFVAKPAADRIVAISQFHQAVGSVAKIRYDLEQSQAQITDPGQRLIMASLAMPRILNEIATAKVMLPRVESTDVGIPQLIVLISEALTSGELESARVLVELAVAKKDVTNYLRAEAKRYEGRYHFAAGNPVKARLSFEQATAFSGDGPSAARAYVLSDAATLELAYGDCKIAIEKLWYAARAISAPEVPPANEMQMRVTLSRLIKQWSSNKCVLPPDLIAHLDP